MTETIATVLKKMKDDLDWRGPTHSRMGHIVLTREQAEHLCRVMLDIIMERDALLFELDQLKGDRDMTNIAVTVSKKPGNEYYNNDVEFHDDGTLSIDGYDGVTILNEAEAKQLGEALIEWANRKKETKP